jgi:antitoxin (DNA-binding transcriptional repressor) of toxin-antitoxin stability system
MKRITASEARRHWFTVLDRVAAGEIMVIERKGRRIVLRREEEQERTLELPEYTALIRPVADVNRADDWSWEWTEEGELRPSLEPGE